MKVRIAEFDDMNQAGHIMSVSFRTAFADFVSPQTMDACAQEDNCIALLEGIFKEGAFPDGREQRNAGLAADKRWRGNRCYPHPARKPWHRPWSRHADGSPEADREPTNLPLGVQRKHPRPPLLRKTRLPLGQLRACQRV